MSMTTGARKGSSCEINVTPLIDVLLVLLIIFMVAMPTRNRGELTQVPQPAPPDAITLKPLEPIVIQLKDAGESKQPDLKINAQPVTWEKLEATLKGIYETRVDRVAFIQGDPEVEFEYVAQVVDISHQAGADRVGLLGKTDLSRP